MANVRFDDFLKQELQDSEIRVGFEKQNEQLVRNVAARNEKQEEADRRLASLYESQKPRPSNLIRLFGRGFIK